MHRFRKILVGVELADASQLVSPRGLRPRCADALAKATWICEQVGAELHIVHALPIGPRAQGLIRRHGAAPGPSPTDLANDMLSTLADGARELGIAATHAVLLGAPDAALQREAERWQADLIVVAGRERGSPLGLLGSTAARLFREADLPVWVARRGRRGPLREILAAVALDEHSHGVLRLAADTARRTGARLHTLHVAEGGDPARATLAGEALSGWTRAHAADVRVGSIEVRYGRPGDLIVRRAAEVHADAVFVGPSKRSALLAGLMGSATVPLLKRLHCSVVCARAVPGSPQWATEPEHSHALAVS